MVLHRPQLDDLHNIHTHLDRVLQASLLTILDVACQACACSAALASISVNVWSVSSPGPFIVAPFNVALTLHSSLSCQPGVHACPTAATLLSL